MAAFDHFNGRRRNLKFPGQESNEGVIRLSFNGRGSYFHFDSISIGTHHLVLGRLGLKVDLQNKLSSCSHLLNIMTSDGSSSRLSGNQGTRMKGIRESGYQDKPVFLNLISWYPDSHLLII
jgi:hypothetical protein